jgi:glycosyltransferase involved in cell wall biosynthesis
MRVLMVSKALVVGAYHRKLEELARLGVDLHLVLPHRWGKQYPEKTQGNGYRVYRLPVLFSGHNHFHFYRNIGRVIRSVRPDIVHIDEEAYSFVTYQVMRHTSRYLIPSLFFNWQNIFKNYPFPFSYFERYNFRHAKVAIAGNEEAKNILREKGCTIPIHVIPQFGVDPEDFSRRPSEPLMVKLFGTTKVAVIGYAGRLVEEKGLLTLVKAFARLPDDTRLLLLGSGPFKERILATARSSGIAHRVVMCDHVPSHEMPEYLSCLHCLVLPSEARPNWKEQFGRILIEAMACSVPVIGADSGEIPNVVGDAGLIFQPGNSDDLSQKLMMILQDDRLHDSLSRKGVERVLTHFTQRHVAKRTYEVYKSMTAG